MQSINDYLEAHRPHLRELTMRKVYGRIRALRDAPYIGRPGRIDGTRELLFAPLPYVVVYRVQAQSVEVLRIYHTSQNRP